MRKVLYALVGKAQSVGTLYIVHPSRDTPDSRIKRISSAREPAKYDPPGILRLRSRMTTLGPIISIILTSRNADKSMPDFVMLRLLPRVETEFEVLTFSYEKKTLKKTASYTIRNMTENPLNH